MRRDHKAEYWLDPERYNEEHTEIDISLYSAREAYRAQISGNFSIAKRDL